MNTKPIYSENMMPAGLDLPVDGEFARRLAKYWWLNEDGTPKKENAIPIKGYALVPPPDAAKLFTMEVHEVVVLRRRRTLELMQELPQVAANIDCDCGQRFIVPIRRIKFGGLYTPTGHRAYILFGIAVTWCPCGRLLWATLGDTSWCRSMEDLFPTLEIGEDDDDR